LFDNLSYGIYGKASNFESVVNVFQNIKRDAFGSFVYGGLGIYATHDSLLATNHFVGNVHPLATATSTDIINRFYDCYIGISLNNIIRTRIAYTDMRNSQSFLAPPTNSLNITGKMGIYVYGNRFNEYKIEDNKLRNLETGIALTVSAGSLSIPSAPNYGRWLVNNFIRSNEIIPLLTFTANTAGARTGTGIYIAALLGVSGTNVILTNTAMRVESNRIKAWRGVQLLDWRIQGYRAIVGTNTIQLQNDPNNMQQYGIAAINSTEHAITTNSITGTGTTNTLTSAVYSSMSDRGIVQCNIESNTFNGFEFASNNQGTTWSNNTMTTNRRGLVLSNVGVMGQQGNANLPMDNKWNGTWNNTNLNTYTDLGSFPTSSPLYVRTTAGYLPTFNQNQGNFNPQTYGFVGTLFSTANTYTFFNCTPAGGGGVGGGGCPTCRVALMENIATDNLTYTTNIVETKEINKDLTFNSITTEMTLTAVSNTLNMFYSNNSSLTRGLYKTIEAALMQGNMPLATSLINQLNPSTNIEQNHKVFYNLLKNYNANNTLSALDNLQLLILAYQCPFTDGQMVYEARSLFNAVNKIIVPFNDVNCMEKGYSFRSLDNNGNSNSLEENQTLLKQLEQSEIENRKKFISDESYVIFPNPAQDYVTIASNNSNETVSITINDATGKTVIVKDVIITNNFGKLDLDLVNGIYIIKLINKEQKHEFKKLVISK
jgi:hypothetical protein